MSFVKISSLLESSPPPSMGVAEPEPQTNDLAAFTASALDLACSAIDAAFALEVMHLTSGARNH